jgi:DNA-binding SARP family transcriptional activator
LAGGASAPTLLGEVHVPVDATNGPALFLLGGIELRGIPASDADRLLTQSKAVALLSFLGLSPTGRYQRRDRVVGMLWPELDQEHARAALRKAVFAVRHALGADVLSTRGDEELTLAPERLWIDVVEFTACTDEGRLARALELYRGELMPGFFLAGCSDFDLWLADQRSAANGRAAAAAWALARSCEAENSYTNAGVWARRAVKYAWGDERVLRRAMTMLDRIGDRAGALKLYDEFARRLRAELEAAPSGETLALVATMKRL